MKTFCSWDSSATVLILSASSFLQWNSYVIASILSSSKSWPIDTEKKPSTVDDDNGADPDSSIKSTDRHRGAPRWSSSSKSPSDLFQQIIQRRQDKTVRLRKCDNAKKPKDDEALFPVHDDRQTKIRQTFHIFMSSSVYDVTEDVREDERDRSGRYDQSNAKSTAIHSDLWRNRQIVSWT